VVHASIALDFRYATKKVGLTAFLDESPERCQAGAWSNHHNGPRRVGRQTEVRVPADKHRARLTDRQPILQVGRSDAVATPAVGRVADHCCCDADPVTVLQKHTHVHRSVT